jgi:hypothetical protein
MAKYDKNTGKVTVQKGDTPTKIAATIYKATGDKVTTKQVQDAISANKTLAARQSAGKTVLFTGTTFKFGTAKSAEAVVKEDTSNAGDGSSFIQPMPEVSTVTPPSPVRLPSRDVVSLVDAGIDSATIQNLLFENIGATELIKFTRHDTVDGINPYYDIISNLSDIKRNYDPTSLISVQKPESSYFDIYTIKLDQKIPNETYLDDNNLIDYVYLDANGNLAIELTNLASDEIIEVEIDSNGTIYEVGEIV